MAQSRLMSRPMLAAAAAVATTLALPSIARAECPSGSYPCGADYCTPEGAVCCASVGRPQNSCPQGSRCLAGGGCESTSSSSSGGSSGSSGGEAYCPSGYQFCGADWCIPSTADCCGDGVYCESGSTCTSSGCLSSSGEEVPASTGTGASGSGSSSGGSSSGSPGTGTQCSEASISSDCRSVKSCCSANSQGTVSCWYEADGKTFDCSGTCQRSDAERVVDYCTGSGSSSDSDSDSDSSACAVTSRGSASASGGAGASLLAALAPVVALLLGARRRRR